MRRFICIVLLSAFFGIVFTQQNMICMELICAYAASEYNIKTRKLVTVRFFNYMKCVAHKFPVSLVIVLCHCAQVKKEDSNKHDIA